MSKKIIISSIDAPFVGGAGTNSYNLIKLFRNILKHNVVGLYIYTEYNYIADPHKIGNILNFNPKKEKIESIKNKIIDSLGGEPDVILTKNYIPVFFLKKIFPRIKLYLLPSGSSFYGHYINKVNLITMSELIKKLESSQLKLYDVVTHKGKWPCYPDSCQPGCDCELRALLLADKIIPNSDITENLFKLLYKNLTIKDSLISKILSYNLTSALYDMSALTGVKRLDFNKRKYDLIFIAYNWNRKLKNATLVENIVNNKIMKKYNILVAGNNSNIIKPTNYNTTILNCINNKHIFEFLMNSRCLACVSWYDSFPNVITEANMCGCNIVSSENVGQAKLLPPKLIVKNFNNVTDWIDKIELGINNKFTPFKIDQISILKELNNTLFKE